MSAEATVDAQNRGTTPAGGQTETLPYETAQRAYVDALSRYVDVHYEYGDPSEQEYLERYAVLEAARDFLAAGAMAERGDGK